MAGTTSFVIALLIGCLICQALVMATSYDEPSYVDREYNSALLNWFATHEFPQRLNTICKALARNMNTAPMPKRNSELINSLLSLPKNMNDAGK